MSALLAVLSDAWPLVLAAAGVLFGVTRHLQAKATAAKAEASVARAQLEVAQQGRAEAQANADAQKAAANAAASRGDIDNDVSAKQPDEVRNELDRWTRP